MKIIMFLFSVVCILLMRAKQAFGYTSVNINTASFSADVIPEYREGNSIEWGEKIANNAAVAYRQSGRAMVINNDLFAVEASRTYDTARDYRTQYMNIRAVYEDTDVSDVPLPRRSFDQEIWTFESTIQVLTSEQNLDRAAGAVWHIKAENTGGFTIINASTVNAWYFTAIVTELRQIEQSG